MKLSTDNFRGEAPRVTPRALPDNASQDATNARLLSGDVSAWNQFATTTSLSGTAPIQSISLLAGSYWLESSDQLDYARGLIPGDDTYRTYITGMDVPRFTNLALASSGAAPYPTSTRILGVPAPESAPTVAAGIDPTPTSFSVEVTDEGDDLSGWTRSAAGGRHLGITDVEHSATGGNPAGRYILISDDNLGLPCFIYRDFGIAQCNAVRMTFDFMHTTGDPTPLMQGAVKVMCNGAGEGILVHMDEDGVLRIGSSRGWDLSTKSMLAAAPNATVVKDIWYTLEVNVVVNLDATQTVTATAWQGSVQLATVSASSSFVLGGFCGFVGEIGVQSSPADWRMSYDNIVVLGSGSTGYNPTNTATSYVYTFVNDLGEESAPSYASVTILRPDGISITVTSPVAVPSGVSSEYGVTTKRIYRAATGATGTAFAFVAEIPLAQADYVDSIPDTELGDPLESEGWELPPDDLRGILALPNGVMVGFRRNQLCFSAQNRPHAWPVKYRLTTDTDIVGIGNIDTTVVIGTESFPYLAFGSDPSAYSMSKLEVPQACVSKRSFAYLTGIGVVFASPDGLIAVAGTGQVRNLTETVFTRDQWQALNPSSILGIAHDDVYHFWYATATGSTAVTFFRDEFTGVAGTKMWERAPDEAPTGFVYRDIDIDTPGTGDAEVDGGGFAVPSGNWGWGVGVTPDDSSWPPVDISAGLTITLGIVVGATASGNGSNFSATVTSAAGDVFGIYYATETAEVAPPEVRVFTGGSSTVHSLGAELASGAHTLVLAMQGAAYTVTLDGAAWLSGATEGGTTADVSDISFGIDFVDDTGGSSSISRVEMGTLASATGTSSGYALDMKPTGFGLVSLAYHATAVHTDPLTDNLYLVLGENNEPTDASLPQASTAVTPDGVTVYEFNGDGTSKMVYRWKSKLYMPPHPVAFFRVRVRSESYDNTIFRLYRQVYSAVYGVWQDILVREVQVESDAVLNLPVGSAYSRCWWEVLSTDTIQTVQVAEDVAELT